MAEILNLDFNQLPRPTRERFVAITRGQAGPQPIFQRQESGVGALGWFFLISLLALCLLGLTTSGFGSAYRATQAPIVAAFYVVLLFLCLLCVMTWIRRSAAAKALPYRPGAYVFPLDTVIARNENGGIKLLSARELSNVSTTRFVRNGRHTRSSFTLSYSDGTRESFFMSPQHAATVLDRLRGEGTQAADALARRDSNRLYVFDPLFEARMSGFQLTNDPSGPLAKSVPSWMRKGSLIALGVACLLGPLAYLGRNLASDEIAFNTASNTYTYRSYLYGGWRHLDEVRDFYLPRAELTEAAQNTDPIARLATVERVAKQKLTPALQAQANQALKDALHAVFEKAKSENTVLALREFQHQHPAAEDIPAAKQRIHQLFQKTLADFTPRASKPDSVPFVAALLDFMERHDSPPLEVRFRRHNAPSLVVADRSLAKPDPRFDKPGSELASASSHFDPEHAAPREGGVLSAMQRGFSEVFPADVLTLTKGADLDPNDTSIPLTTTPTIFVDYTVGWSGSTYLDPDGGRRFVGVIYDFDVAMTIPNNGKVLKLKLKVRPPHEFSVSDAPSDAQVYEVMSLRAFDELSSKIQEELFRPR